METTRFGAAGLAVGGGVAVATAPTAATSPVVSLPETSAVSGVLNGSGQVASTGGTTNATVGSAASQQPSITPSNNTNTNSSSSNSNNANNGANNLKRNSMRPIGGQTGASDAAAASTPSPSGGSPSGGAVASAASTTAASTATAVIDTIASTVSYHRRPYPDATAAQDQDARYNGAGANGIAGSGNGLQHVKAGAISNGIGGPSLHHHPGGAGQQKGHLVMNGSQTPTPGAGNTQILTQAGLEEYSRQSYYEQTTMYHHQKQSSYAQSEGYHSYVSSSDSSSTPFLDRLRQDSELLLSSRSSHNWSQQDLQQLAVSSAGSSIGDSHSSAESNSSSTETLKWLGSMSDVSVASHATGTSALSSAGSTSQLIAHSSRVRTPQRHNSESILYIERMSNDDQSTLGGVSQSTGSLLNTLTHRQQQQQSLHHHHQQQQQNHNRPPPQQQQQPQHRHSHLLANGANGNNLSPTSPTAAASSTGTGGTTAPGSGSPTGSTTSGGSASATSRSSRSNNRLFPISTYTEPPGVGVAGGGGGGSTSNGSSAGGAGSMTDFKQLNSHNWQSVAERINELEKHQQQHQHHGISLHSSSTSSLNSATAGPGKTQLSQLNLAAAAAAAAAVGNSSSLSPSGKQQQRYTYFDPSKTHRISNPSLKAFQKNAVISYFERQQQHARESIHQRPTSLNLSTGSAGSPGGASTYSGGSASSSSPPSSVATVVSPGSVHSQRSSISSAYSSATGSMMELSNGGCPLSMGSYSPPSSLAVQQQLDKLAVNNLRNQLASVHTMNLLNKVVVPSGLGEQQHLQQQHQQQQMISNATLILSSAQTNGLPGSSPTETLAMTSESLELISSLDGAPPPPPPPRNRASMVPMGGGSLVPYPSAHMAATVRRTSSASEYSSIRDKLIQQRQQLSKDLLGPMIMGPIIALDDWVPERPPKNPMLRIPSPELPPPPPPLLHPTEDVLIINQDEPLPPPPPEILRHMRQLSDSGDSRSNSASRRNSFAGQTNKKSLYRASTFENLSPPGPQQGHPGGNSAAAKTPNGVSVPPVVPKKPQQSSPADGPPANGHRRPASSMAKTQTVPSLSSHAPIGSVMAHHHHRMQQHAGGGRTSQEHHRLSLPMQQTVHSAQSALMIAAVQPQFVAGRQSDTRISVRKRTHNSQQIPVSEYLLKANGTTPPPPLKPRMPVQPLAECNGQQATVQQMQQQFLQHQHHHHHQQQHQQQQQQHQQQYHQHQQLISMGSKRSNSKASYLPRQPRDKLHSSDPDHGSYKLTLTSNEDCINHTTAPNSGAPSSGGVGGTAGTDCFPEEIIASPKCNLPDVLPPGVKYSLYSTNNNNNNNNSSNIINNNNNSLNNHHNGKPAPKHGGVLSSHSAPIIATANSLKSLFNFGTPSPVAGDPPKDPACPPTPSPPAALFNGTSPPSLHTQIQATSPKYTSQSSFDLKKTQILETSAVIGGDDGGGMDYNGYHLCNGGTGTGGILGLPATPNTSHTSSVVIDSPTPHGNCAQQVPPPLPSTPIPSLGGANSYGPWPLPASQPAPQTVHNCLENAEKSTNFEPGGRLEADAGAEGEQEVASTVGSATNTAESAIGSAVPTVGASTHDALSANETETNAATVAKEEDRGESRRGVVAGGDSVGGGACGLTPGDGGSNEPSELSSSVGEVAGIGGRGLLQRTEIVLRVQAPTSEAASQTENPQDVDELLGVAVSELTIDTIAGSRKKFAGGCSDRDAPSEVTPPGTPGKESGGRFFGSATIGPAPATPRKPHPEEIDCDKLSHDLVSQLSPSDKLHTILAPKTFKSSSDYVSALFNIQVAPRPLKKDASTATPAEGGGPQKSPLDILTSSSTYFQISEPKAKLMTRYSREMTLINGDCCDLTKKKEELVQRLGKKLLVLTNEQTSIAEESSANDLLGNDVALKVTQKVRPADASKFRSYVDDVGYITMLLLSLSGRLARTDNALHNIEATHPDKKILEAKRDRLLEQLAEAKELKDDIDRRGAIIARILEQALTIEEYADFDYFINMKAKLIVDSREITDKIKLGEEQLAALKDTLVQSEC
ncbi:protein Shroom [Anopheles cruzii]|uniref:protein Shroom n=1 Tax=Anopheles cruzii TaxID=68878 RepID=UPI0022EC1DDA|nr:protein Shroom [Anopheles cruzii]